MKKFSATHRLVILTGILFSVGILLSFQQYANNLKKQTLKHYLHTNSIKSMKIVSDNDTVTVQQLDAFLSEIGTAKRIGKLKFPCTMKILITRKFKDDETILTNGKILEYEGYCYSATSDIITKYLNP